MEYHELLNHTECGCAAVPRDPPVHDPAKSQPGYGGILTPGYTHDVQPGYGVNVPGESQPGYGGTSTGYGSGGSVGFRVGDSSGEDNSTTSTTEAADVKTNQVNNDTLIFSE